MSAVSLSGCPEDFKDAFVANRKLTIEAHNLVLELLANSNPVAEQAKKEESRKKTKESEEAFDYFLDVCRKYGLKANL